MYYKKGFYPGKKVANGGFFPLSGTADGLSKRLFKKRNDKELCRTSRRDRKSVRRGKRPFYPSLENNGQ